MAKKRKCENRLCDNLSRSFEKQFCSILCADTHDGIISELEWISINPYESWLRQQEENYSREKHLKEVYNLLKKLGYYDYNI